MEKNTELYANYGLDDFLNDDDFKNWVKYPDQDSNVYWNKIISSFPEKKEMVIQAQQIIFLLSKQTALSYPESKERVWLNIEKNLALKYNYPFRRIVQLWTSVAAAVILCVGLGYSGYYFYQNSEKVYPAAFGELRTLNLPDGSRVVLNSNSEIRYQRKWQTGNSRELWMKGEVLFDVKHVALSHQHSVADTFKVHTGNLTVTVLGTEFNVKNRRNLTHITLKRGKIRLNFNDLHLSPVYLKPGDNVDYNNLTGKVIKNKAEPNDVIAWAGQKLILQGEYLSDVIQVLEDNYGYHVVLKDPSLGNRKLKGTIPLHNADDLIFVISKVFNVNIERNADTLIIHQ